MIPSGLRGFHAACFVALTGAPMSGAFADFANGFEDPLILINEIDPDAAAAAPDWIEFYNPGVATVDLSLWYLTDSDPTHIFVFPMGTTLAPGGYLVLDQNSPNSFTFGLGAASDAVKLYASNNVIVDQYDWSTPPGTGTFARCPDGIGAFAVRPPTRATANACSALVVINEIEPDDLGGGPDWIELHNAGPVAADLSSWSMTDSNPASVFTFPPGTVLAPGAYLALDQNAPNSFTFGLGASSDAVVLYTPAATVADQHSWNAAPGTSTLARCPNGTGAFGLAAPSHGTANPCP